MFFFHFVKNANIRIHNKMALSRVTYTHQFSMKIKQMLFFPLVKNAILFTVQYRLKKIALKGHIVR